MSFEANRTLIVLGAITTQFIVEHPQLLDANIGNPLTRGLRNTHCEVANATTGTVYIAFDRAVVAPSGNGVQGAGLPSASRALTGPVAATPGDFDLAILAASGWPALDFVIPYNSTSMSIYTTAAGAVAVSYGLNDNG